jgi:D-amino peptidase
MYNLKLIFKNMKVIYTTILSIICWMNVSAFKVYIFADMEGCSQLTNREQLNGSEGPVRMAQDINACIEGCFLAGATEVIVKDGHGGGVNVDPALINPKARLIQGATPGERFKDIEGSEALILLGYHGMAQTKNALFAHSFSSATIQMMYLNGKPVGEIGIDASIAGEHHVPVVMVSGDDKTMKEAKEWIPGVVTCQVKKGTSHLSGKCLTLTQSYDLIKKRTAQALKNRNSIKPVKANYPATLRWEYIPNGHPRVYDPKFIPVMDPRSKERSSENSVEQILLGL